MRRPSVNQKNANREQIIEYSAWYRNNPLQHARVAHYDSRKAYDLQALSWVLEGLPIPSMNENLNPGMSFEANMRSTPDLNYDQMKMSFPTYNGSKLQKISMDNDAGFEKRFYYYKDAKIPISALVNEPVPSQYLKLNPKRVNASKRYAKQQRAEFAKKEDLARKRS